MKRGLVFVFLVILLFSMMFVSAGWFGDLWRKITGKVPDAVCGNGIVEPGEICDDGNTVNGDFCNLNCQCSDSDGGANPLVKGNAHTSNMDWPDVCWTSHSVAETVCFTQFEIQCESGQCLDGACLPPIPECTDTDDSYNDPLVVKGTACGANDCRTDYCASNTNIRLEEAYCFQGNAYFQGKNCASKYYCSDGACILNTSIVCGNNLVDEGEQCDGNTVSCNGSNGYMGSKSCSGSCTWNSCVITESCGDHTVNGNEQCDDNNTISGDGCSSTCVLEINNSTNNGGNSSNGSFLGITVTPPSSGGNSGGGGGGGGSSIGANATEGVGTNVTQNVTTITPTSPAVINISDSQIYLTKITLNVLESIQSASVTVTKVNVLSDANLAMGLPSGQFYQGFRVDTSGVTDSNIANVTIEFKVNKLWLTDQNGTVGGIGLYRKPDPSSNWNSLVTTLTSQDSVYYYFTSVSPGFSTFAVFSKPCEGSECIAGTTPNKLAVWIYIIIAVVGVAIIIVFYFLFRKSKENKVVVKKKVPKV